MRKRRKTLLSKPQNVRVMRKVKWMMRSWLCWLEDLENFTRRVMSRESLEVTKTKRRRKSQLLDMNARSPDTFDRNVPSSQIQEENYGGHVG